MKFNLDLPRYGSSFTKAFLFKPGYRFMVLYRYCNSYSSKSPIGFLIRIWYRNIQVKYGFQIPHTCKIGIGLFMGHYGNIIINQKSIIGDNCNIAQGVTIGNINKGSKKGSPTIGNEVWIGANSVLVGKITVGNNVLIAPLSYINFDVPDNAIIIGNPGKVVSYKGSGQYINSKCILP